MTFGVEGWVTALAVHVFAVLPGAASTPASNDEFCDASPSKVDGILEAQATSIALDYRLRPATPDLGFYAASTACLSRCRKTRPEIAGCLTNLNRFLDGNCQTTDRDRVLGTDLSDRDYIAAAKKVFGGEMMSVPQEILDAATKYLGLGDFSRAMDRLGYKHISYGSSLLDGRFAILIEGARFDRVVQFATNAGILTPNVDFIALQKRSENGTPLARPRAWFNGYNYAQNVLHQKSPLSTRCLSCHANGWRQIHTAYLAKPTSTADASYEYIRKRIDETGPSDFAFFDPKSNGPPLGAIDPPGRLDAISKGCACGLPPERQRAIAEAMSCAKCHDGKRLGILNATTSYYWSLKHKVATLSVRPAMAMPPSSAMLHMDRSIMVTCLRQEYTGQLKSWLTATRCVAPAVASR